ncbi:MAG: 30S ribosomal protein S8 [Planctomycetota bacterium]
MSMTDPVADLLTRIRNTNSLGKETVRAPYSKLKQEILKVMEREGFIAGHAVEESSDKKKSLAVKLKYGPDGETVIRSISRVSKPGRRVFRKSADLEPVLRGMGILIVSTSQGLLSDGEARQRRVGGEVLCEVY